MKSTRWKGRIGVPVFVVLWLALAGAGALGWLKPVDSAIGDLRFSATTRSATHTIIYVDIDSQSLKQVGVWPWPRHLHAQMLNELMRLDADNVVFDVDFSAASSESEDAAFEQALRDAGGYAMLASFQQREANSASTAFNLPIARFRQYAEPVAVNVGLDTLGTVRDYPYAVELGGTTVNSVAAVLSSVHGAAGSTFGIDYSIDPDTVERISAADLLSGRVAPELVAGKNVVIGASALELRDFFVVPRYTLLPGALLQIMAAETLKQNRAMGSLGPAASILATLLIMVVGLFFRRWLRPWIVVPAGLAIAALLETGALFLQLNATLIVGTAGIELALAVLAIKALTEEIRTRGEERAKAEARLRFLAHHDPVTGALSRLALIEQLTAKLAEGVELGVVALDLRRFRAINDTLGHSQGDLLLSQVVKRLNDVAPGAVARLGGDSFAMIVPPMDGERMVGFCHTITQLLSSPYELAEGHQALIAASAGATCSTLSARDAETLLSHADMALSVAKHSPGKGAFLFQPSMDDRLRGRQAMDSALRGALADGQFSIVYQPQVDLASGEIVGAEALARWTHPTLGPVSAAEFVAAAEETGLIVELGRWMLNSACSELALWPSHTRLAVNVSPAQFELSDVVADVSRAIARSGIAPHRLDIEITEGIFVRNAAVMREKLTAVRDLGVGVALDDFGTGYSSLAYLGQLPIDKIKIDQSFVKRLPGDGEAIAIITAVLSLAAALNKDVVAEGVETLEQSKLLKLAGCAIGQGYYFGRPLPGAELRMLLERPDAALAG